MRDYHRLEIWRRAHALAIAIHDTARDLRGNEFAALRSQLTRAADSVAATMVEGSGAATAREFARFLDMSIKSAAETEYHLLSARDRRALTDRRWQQLSAEVVQVRRMTHVYRKRLLEDDK
ncbi:MAG TPA: four helix bundle protein [Gemmatimonadaceae bacterium]|nr:four helix bundle protein [Gemmatimonadaceae bacterium]